MRQRSDIDRLSNKLDGDQLQSPDQTSGGIPDAHEL